ncbi:hypothetical protein ACGFYQ_19925 [Streptomyces sp. NPDC048258]|uniref:hypothetical protein n=1 Tax=Streptomyces sp. NPDC048258 TaxID=3365527 RepID=UPI0037237E55
MQLRRAVPLSLLALLASAGCVSVGPQASAPVPARGSVPPADAADVPPPVPLPLGELPAAAADAPDPSPDPDANPEPSAARPRAKTSRPSAGRPRAAKPTHPHPRRKPAPPPRMDELCAAAEGSVPPSIVDLCLRQYGH